jgi:hypothetical protein
MRSPHRRATEQSRPLAIAAGGASSPSAPAQRPGGHDVLVNRTVVAQ